MPWSASPNGVRAMCLSSARRISLCAGFICATRKPRFSLSSALRDSLGTIPADASLGITASLRCASSRDFTSSRPKFSSRSSTRSPFLGPCRTSAGLEPKNEGVSAIPCPATSVKLTERWCPSTRHPQASASEGVPKIEKKYKSGSRSDPFPCSISRSISSRLMIVMAFT